MEIKYAIVFDSLAKESFTEAYFYLKSESPAAANGFKEELEYRLLLISKTPYMSVIGSKKGIQNHTGRLQFTVTGLLIKLKIKR